MVTICTLNRNHSDDERVKQSFSNIELHARGDDDIMELEDINLISSSMSIRNTGEYSFSNTNHMPYRDGIF